VFGCANSDYKLLNWASSHECLKQTIDECGCTPPFELLPFPVKKTIPLLEVNGQNWSIEEIQKMQIKFGNQTKTCGFVLSILLISNQLREIQTLLYI
jgi:hypothetical protein